MRLTVVGCSGSYPGPDSPASCYLVEAPYDGGTHRLVLDLGNGAIGPLQRHTDLLDVDAVLLSHLHADHCLDLCPYYVVRKFHPDRPSQPLPVYGPAGTADRIAAACDLPGFSDRSQEFAFHRWQPGTSLTLGPFQVDVTPMEHPGEAYAMRVQHDGRVLAYSGDTGPCDALVEVARDADLLLCEASFLERPDNPTQLHLTGREAGEHATKAAARRLVLTHVPAWHDAQQVLAEATPAYGGPLELATPGVTYDV